MSTITIQDQEIPCTIRKSKRARHIRLSFDDFGNLIITVPKWNLKQQGVGFAHSKSDWILKHFDRLETQRRNHANIFHTGSKLTLLGEESITLIISPTIKKRPHFLFQNSTLTCFIPHHFTAQTQEVTRELLEKFYRQTALSHLTQRTDFFTQTLGLKYNRIFLKDQKTRWGSCSRLKNLNFNFRIILATPHVVDYLVIHEVCHLKHLNHSQKFWDLVASIMPDYKVNQDWLKKNGFKLRF